MTSNNLGSLERVDLRDVWVNVLAFIRESRFYR